MNQCRRNWSRRINCQTAIPSNARKQSADQFANDNPRNTHSLLVQKPVTMNNDGHCAPSQFNGPFEQRRIAETALDRFLRRVLHPALLGRSDHAA
ncbi:MAG: hypothetical protein QM739_03835 [Propionivibrio sp.]